MTDLPTRIEIHEEGPREGFQIEAGPISTADKVRFCEALAETGLHDVQCVSFVDPRRVLENSVAAVDFQGLQCDGATHRVTAVGVTVTESSDFLRSCRERLVHGAGEYGDR